MTDQGYQPNVAQVWLMLILGLIAVSTASIFIRLAMGSAGESGIGFSIFIAATRLSFASLVLAPTWRHIAGLKLQKSAYIYAIAAGIALALHFSLWISSLSFISVAASTSLVTTNPIWVALISWFWLGEKLPRRTVLGITFGIFGSILVAFGDRSEMITNTSPLLGSLLALTGSWAVSFYFLFGREAQKRGLTIRHYATIAYTTAALILLPLPMFWGVSYWGYSLEVYGYILAMTAIAQLFGHTSLNWAMRWLSPVIVTLLILFEPIGASILSFLILGEVPSLWVMGGGSVIFLGVAIAIFTTQKKSQV